MTISEIIAAIEEKAPLAYQEPYDNAGLTVGDRSRAISSALLTIDVTEEVVEEALEKGAGLIISHHPILFSGIKKITGHNFVERTIIKAIKHDIAIYSAHTNLDSVMGGVNSKICEKLGLINCKILNPIKNELLKLVTFVPSEHAEKIRMALFSAGAGHIGNYDNCSFNMEGKGTFRGLEGTIPYVGEQGKLHVENETRVETIFPKNIKTGILRALMNAHPYEEVAFDIYPLENTFEKAGMGMIGELAVEQDAFQFLQYLKNTFHCGIVRYTRLTGNKIKKVAVCGGSGISLLQNAISARADIFITADVKYHQFYDAENKIIIADIGHFESEQYTKEIFYEIVNKKFPNFALHLSETNSNPINYL
jgi:dinuclear metal center YbgI/SA1388 family protein